MSCEHHHHHHYHLTSGRRRSSQRASQVLVQVLVQALLQSLVQALVPVLVQAPFWPLIQKPAAPLVFNLSSLTLPHSLHWLPVAASVKNTSTWYRAVNGSGPVHIQDMVKPHSPSTPLCIDQSAAPSQRGTAVTQQHHNSFLSWLLNDTESRTLHLDTRLSVPLIKPNQQQFVNVSDEQQLFLSSCSVASPLQLKHDALLTAATPPPRHESMIRRGGGGEEGRRGEEGGEHSGKVRGALSSEGPQRTSSSPRPPPPQRLQQHHQS
ncbi:unnamed protein product [Pleuronectes platessa]|uniref:Uncharacterized protein n=1 Tax=Pleuronectes platessa TaxID=8262 RepID=A0A9N7VLA4_PLEPL|nr:unnamed protein product [Pleuronectes platessa]